MNTATHPVALVVGGTSGIGLEAAKQLERKGYSVIITGRHDPLETGLTYRHLELNGPNLARDISDCVAVLPRIDTVLYAAGFYQEGLVDEFRAEQLAQMVNVGLSAPMQLTSELLAKQGEIPVVAALTSTSQFTPRVREAPYTAVKAGLAMYLRSLALDPGVGHVRIIAPSGTDTRFWHEVPGKDRSVLMSAKRAGELVAQILWREEFFLFAMLRRMDDDVVVVESSDTAAEYRVLTRNPV